MREIRQSGLEGGGTELNRSSLPLSTEIGLLVLTHNLLCVESHRRQPRAPPPKTGIPQTLSIA